MCYSFENVVDFVLKHEGGYVVDHAGPTNFGITLKTLKNVEDWDGDGWLDGDVDQDGDIDADDVQSMPRTLAIEIYRKQWWQRYRYNRITHIEVAKKIMDMSVNMGPNTAHIIIQTALRACNKTVEIDGILGPITIQAINSCAPLVLVAAVRCESAGFYRLLVNKKPRFIKYIKGWLNRAYA